MTRAEIDSLVHDLRETVEDRLGVDLTPIAAIRLEQRIFDALAFGRNNLFRQADRLEQIRLGHSPWK